MMKFATLWNLILLIVILFGILFTTYSMEQSESDEESEDIESQVQVNTSSAPSQGRNTNVNVQIMGFDPTTEKGKKKMKKIMELVRAIIDKDPTESANGTE